MSKKSTSIKSKMIKEIIRQVTDGNFRIPNFQRNFVWKEQDIVSFLNSLIQGHPFGFIVIWESKDKFFEEKNDIIIYAQNKQNTENNLEKLKYIIDGQQRITIIVGLHILSTMSKNDKETHKNKKIVKMLEKIYYCFKNNKFILITKKYKKDSLEMETKIQASKFLQYIGQGESIEKIQEICKNSNDCVISLSNKITKINEINVGIIRLNKFRLDDAIEAFRKINTKGRKLTTFNIIHARWTRVKIDLIQENEAMNEELKDFGFKLKDEILHDVVCLSFPIKPLFDKNDKFKFEFKDIKSSPHDVISRARKGIRKACELLQQINFNTSTLPSEIIIKWLSYIFIKNNFGDLGQNQIQHVKKYIFLISLNLWYSSSTSQKLRKDIAFANRLIKNENKENKVIDDDIFDIKSVNIEKIKDTKYKYLSMFDKYILSLLQNISLNISNGTKFKNFKKSEQHHIFPLKAKHKSGQNFENVYEKDINSLCNIIYLNGEQNKKIGNKRPSKYYETFDKFKNIKEKEKIWASIGCNIQALKEDNFELFIKFRAEFIKGEIEKNIGK